MKTIKVTVPSNYAGVMPYEVEVIKHKSISILRGGKLLNVFALGEEAEYGSYNLKYTGRITGITDKTVRILAYPDSPMNSKVHLLKLSEFCWRNEDFDAEKVAKHNYEEMMFL